MKLFNSEMNGELRSMKCCFISAFKTDFLGSALSCAMYKADFRSVNVNWYLEGQHTQTNVCLLCLNRGLVKDRIHLEKKMG